jgi:hypothetical protein
MARAGEGFHALPLARNPLHADEASTTRVVAVQSANDAASTHRPSVAASPRPLQHLSVQNALSE